MADLAGKFNLLPPDDGGQAFTKFLQALGVSGAALEAQNMITSLSEEFRSNGDGWTLTSTSDLGTESVSFRFGEEVRSKVYDAIDTTSVFTEHATGVDQDFTIDGHTARIRREQTRDGMTTVCAYRGTSAVRKFRRTA
ncbi:hypothetical protein ACFWBC_05675 [Streptomyces sp. NPDC059985]|uniref:hypothetical protein n=1 Tax=Streptomyces sp. NPDC059985 TaxID=3347025 RepID=UPI00367BB98B